MRITVEAFAEPFHHDQAACLVTICKFHCGVTVVLGWLCI